MAVVKNNDSKNQSSPHGCSSDDDSLSESDMEAENTMKRSHRFSSSFSVGEAQQPQSRNEDRQDEELPKSSYGKPVTELVTESMRRQQQDANQPSRSGVFRPQELWLAMTKCFSLWWPPRLSINTQSDRKLAYQVDLNQSEETQSSDSSETTNGSSTSTSILDKIDVALAENDQEDVGHRVVKNRPPPRQGLSRSCSRLLQSRQASDSLLALLSLEKDMFLRIELVDTRQESDDLSYRAEWKLSERTNELAEGVWLSRNQRLMD
ncbi:hypothetical protein LDENG_00150300 [Lucifuga dentata]|nr:hypothetical protein LDENG_00150300 [Lucifuga dentata]